MGSQEHAPVMPERVAALLAPALADRDAVLVDATLGLAGHAEILLAKHPRLRLVGLDRDPDALARSRRRLAPYVQRTTLVHATYDDIPSILDELGYERADGALFDLGMSSLQVDSTDRGFAYSSDAPLDMRMDPSGGRSAADVVNTYTREGLARLLRQYGEERFARRIAEAIVRERDRDPVVSTRRLADIVRGAVPAAGQRAGGNPAKRAFQALRIEVNAELDMLGRALPGTIDVLTLRGRIAVLAYHSLEDRLVKRTFAARATDTTPRDLPVPLAAHKPQLRLVTRGAERPSDGEVSANPRAASARLRGAERIREKGTAA